MIEKTKEINNQIKSTVLSLDSNLDLREREVKSSDDFLFKFHAMNTVEIRFSN